MFIFFYLPFVLVAHVGLIGILCLIIWAETSYTYMRMYLLLLSILLYVLKFNNTPICYYFMHFRLYYSVSQVPKGNMIHQILFPDPVFCFTDMRLFVVLQIKAKVCKTYINSWKSFRLKTLHFFVFISLKMLARDCIRYLLLVQNMLLNVCFWQAVNRREKSNTKETAVSKKLRKIKRRIWIIWMWLKIAIYFLQ